MTSDSVINVAKRPGLGSVACVAVAICAVTAVLGDWFLAPQLAMFASLHWHTTRDLYATLPGFIIGYLLGVTFSSGIGPAAALDCGLVGGTFVAPINAICRGFWRAGVALLLGIVAYIAAVQCTLWVLSTFGR
jgi:hypothetical protein